MKSPTFFLNKHIYQIIKCLYSLQKLNIIPEIVNRKIRVIGTDWISECFEKKSLIESQPYEFILPSIEKPGRETESNKRKFEIDIQPVT